MQALSRKVVVRGDCGHVFGKMYHFHNSSGENICAALLYSGFHCAAHVPELKEMLAGHQAQVLLLSSKANRCPFHVNEGILLHRKAHSYACTCVHKCAYVYMCL